MKFLLLLFAAQVTMGFQVDPERVKMIDSINHDPTLHWKAGIVPIFANQPLNAPQRRYGSLPSSQANLKLAVAEGRVRHISEATVSIPTSFDSATNWPHCAKTIGDVRDQSNCGCCWAFGAAEAASDRMCIATNASLLFPLSAQDNCFCAERGGCNGGEGREAWEYIRDHGLVSGGQINGTGPFGAGYCSEFSLPHCHHHGPLHHGGDNYPAEGAPGCPDVRVSPRCPSKCDDGAKAPHNSFAADKYTFKGEVTQYGPNADAIAQAIMEHGPVEVCFTVYADFEAYVGGIYKHKSGGMKGGHCVKMVGWGEENSVKYWKVANSWNPYWGESGYFRIVRGVDECGIESDVVASSPGATWAKRS